MNFQGVENGIRGIQQGLCDGFYAQNTNILNGFAGVQNSLTNGFAGVDNAVCTLGYQTQQGINSVNVAGMQNTFALQQAINDNTVAGMQNTNALQAQQADCCCKTQSNLKDIQFQNAQDTCAVTNTIQNTTRDIIDNNNAGIRAILDKMCQQELAAKDAQIAAQGQKIFGLELAASQSAQNNYLIGQLRPCPIPAYVTCNPWAASYGYGYDGYNNSGCNCNRNFA